MHNENAHKHTHLLLDLHTSSRRPLSSDLFSTWRREGRIEGSLIQGTELKIHHNYTQTKKNINSVLFITSATLRCREDDGKSVIGENKHIWWGSGQGVWRSNRNDMSMSQKGRERTKDKKKKKKKRQHRQRNWCVLLQVLCSSQVWTRSLHRPTNKMPLQKQKAEQVKIGTLHHCSVCVCVCAATCVCLAPLALHSIAICCWRNSSWQEVTCNAVTMAAYERGSDKIKISALSARFILFFINNFILKTKTWSVFVSLCSQLWIGPVVPIGKRRLC